MCIAWVQVTCMEIYLEHHRVLKIWDNVILFNAKTETVICSFIDLHIVTFCTSCCNWYVCSKSSPNRGNKVYSFIHSFLGVMPLPISSGRSRLSRPSISMFVIFVKWNEILCNTCFNLCGWKLSSRNFRWLPTCNLWKISDKRWVWVVFRLFFNTPDNKSVAYIQTGVLFWLCGSTDYWEYNPFSVTPRWQNSATMTSIILARSTTGQPLHSRTANVTTRACGRYE